MRYKQQTEVLHETKQTIRGDEPFLRFARPHMIVSLNGFGAGSHNFFEGYFEAMARIKKGDTLAFQWVRVSQVEMTRWERVCKWLEKWGYEHKLSYPAIRNRLCLWCWSGLLLCMGSLLLGVVSVNISLHISQFVLGLITGLTIGIGGGLLVLKYLFDKGCK